MYADKIAPHMPQENYDNIVNGFRYTCVGLLEARNPENLILPVVVAFTGSERAPAGAPSPAHTHAVRKMETPPKAGHITYEVLRPALDAPGDYRYSATAFIRLLKHPQKEGRVVGEVLLFDRRRTHIIPEFGADEPELPQPHSDYNANFIGTIG